ncbi:MAG: AarF/UbiB family protein [Candidatus Promineifilaceae bacterium]|nr:AarF/UbiB family protein [Candidatus Promineifilaceae bacterium]
MITDNELRGAQIDRERYRRITRFFAGVIIHLLWWDVVARRLFPVRVLNSRPQRWRALSRQFRQLAVQMGGVLIKLGQFLSIRVDVLPPEITDELKGLQDEVPPVPTPAILAVIEAELGPVDAHFARIEETPLAAASLGQVHRAWLRPDAVPAGLGEQVAVKVQRPHIESTVRTDLAALRVVVRWAMRYGPLRRRADLPTLLEEFASTLWEELDYELEAENAQRFARMFAGNPHVCIPAVYERHSTSCVLVLEYVRGIKVDDVTALEAAGIRREAVAAQLLDSYFKQIFEEAFFHADPHPGNLFIQPRDTLATTTEPRGRPFRLVFVDFGMVGRIESLMGQQLYRVLVAVTQKDARALTEAYQALGFFLPGADLDRITEAQAVMLDKMWGRNLLELAQPDPEEVQEIMGEFKDLLFDFPFQVPHDFLYLGRAIGILSGLTSTLDPEINPWYQIEKYGRQVVASRQVRQSGLEALLDSLRPLVGLPAQAQRVLSAAEMGRIRVQSVPDNMTRRRLERIERRLLQLQLTVATAFGALFALLLYLAGRDEEGGAG